MSNRLKSIALSVTLCLVVVGLHSSRPLCGQEPSPTPLEAASVTIQGSCVDESNAPLAGVRVRLMRWGVVIGPRRVDAAGRNVSNVEAVAERMTNEKGELSFPLDDAVQEDMLRSFLVMEAKDRLVESRALTLRPAGQGGGFNPVRQMMTKPQLTGSVRLVDEAKKPIAGATIRYIGGYWPDGALVLSEKFGASVATDENGVAAIPLSANAAAVWVTARGYLPVRFELRHAAPQPGTVSHRFLVASKEPVDVPLRATGVATGRVVDARTGDAVPGMTVVALVQPGWSGLPEDATQTPGLLGLETVSDEQGRFRLEGLPLQWTLVVAFDATRAGDVEGRLVERNPWEVGDLFVERMGVYRGLVWDRTPNGPVNPGDSGLRVAFHSTALGPRWSAPVDKKGEFAIPIPAALEGVPKLVPHPHWAQTGVGSPFYAPTIQTPYTLRVQQVSPPIPGAELMARLREFPKDYSLPDRVVARRINPPFTQSRQAFYQFLRKKSGAVPEWLKPTYVAFSQMDTPPMSMLLTVDDQGNFVCHEATAYEIWLNKILLAAYPQLGTRLELRRSGIERESFAGDLVVRANLPFPESVPALEKVLRDQCGLPIKLSVSEAEMDALVVTGRLDSRTLAEKKLTVKLTEQSNQPTSSYSGKPRDLIRQAGYVLGLHTQIDAEIEGDYRTTVAFTKHRATPTENNARGRDEAQRTEQAVMRRLAPAALHDQFGLTFEIRKTKVPTLIVEPGPPLTERPAK